MTQDWRTALKEHLRACILSAEAEVTEEIKWIKPTNPAGVPTFYASGLLCTLETYKDKVKITFAKGASVSDPDGLFNASLTAGTRRAIDFFSQDDFVAPQLTSLVQSAIAVNRSK